MITPSEVLEKAEKKNSAVDGLFISAGDLHFLRYVMEVQEEYLSYREEQNREIQAVIAARDTEIAELEENLSYHTERNEELEDDYDRLNVNYEKLEEELDETEAELKELVGENEALNIENQNLHAQLAKKDVTIDQMKSVLSDISAGRDSEHFESYHSRWAMTRIMASGVLNNMKNIIDDVDLSKKIEKLEEEIRESRSRESAKTNLLYLVRNFTNAIDKILSEDLPSVARDARFLRGKIDEMFGLEKKGVEKK